MKGIINVTGKDKVGIIATVCTFLAKNDMNILEISQDIAGGYLNMIMIVDISKVDSTFDSILKEVEQVGNEIQVQIRLQRVDIFDSMHRI